MLTKNRFLLNSDPAASGGSGEPPTSKKESTPPPPPETSGDNDDAHLDFYGTKEPKEGIKEQKKDSPPEPQQKEAPPTPKPDAPVGGYDSEKEPEVDPPAPPAPPEPPKSLKEELGYELDLKDVEEASAKEIVKFAKDHKLPEDAAKAFVEMTKANAKALAADKEKRIADYNAEVKKTKAAWHKELKEDKNFGGDNFAHSLGTVSKVLDLMPEVKDDLTKSGNMLPPKVMRGLKAIGDLLFKTEESVMGDPPGKEEENYDPLSFYKT